MAEVPPKPNVGEGGQKNPMYTSILTALALISGVYYPNTFFTSTDAISPFGGAVLTVPAVVNGLWGSEKQELRSEIYEVWVTAYSSSHDETDDTPFITASGGQVRDGVIAANFLPFGTKVMVPSLFGDKVFIVEDRMHSRKTNNIDIWMQSKKEALEFGITRAEMVVGKPPELLAER